MENNPSEFRTAPFWVVPLKEKEPPLRESILSYRLALDETASTSTDEALAAEEPLRDAQRPVRLS